MAEKKITVTNDLWIRGNDDPGTLKAFKANHQYCYDRTKDKKLCGCMTKHYVVICDSIEYDIVEDAAVETTVDIPTGDQDFRNKYYTEIGHQYVEDWDEYRMKPKSRDIHKRANICIM